MTLLIWNVREPPVLRIQSCFLRSRSAGDHSGDAQLAKKQRFGALRHRPWHGTLTRGADLETKTILSADAHRIQTNSYCMYTINAWKKNLLSFCIKLT